MKLPQVTFNRDLVLGTFTMVFVAVLSAFSALWLATALVLGSIEIVERIA
jgi:hypothetical protein